MLRRMATDVSDFAGEHNASSVSNLSFINAAAIVADDKVRAEAEEALKTLIDTLTKQRDADAAYVREALPLIVSRARTVSAGPVDDTESQQRERELFRLGQMAEQKSARGSYAAASRSDLA